MFVFDESLQTLLTRTRAWARSRSPHRSGPRHVKTIDPAELSPGELAHAIRARVERDGAIVVIDSLNGYMNAMPDERFLTVQLHELLSLPRPAERGDDADRRAERADREPDELTRGRHVSGGRGGPAALLRSRRGGAAGDLGDQEARRRHERTIREFRLEAGGIRVGEPLSRFRGILTGVPAYEGAPRDLMERP
jgi:circadian clock protein KaiC